MFWGDIARCDEVAMGIINSYSMSSSRVPLLVQLVGTNEAEGRKLLRRIGIETFGDMEEMAQRAVELLRRL